MATVTLDDLYLHDASDPSSYVVVSLSGEREQSTKPGEVRRRAGGRLQAVVRDGSFQALDVTAELAGRSDIDQLRSWHEAGTVLLYREPRGRKLWGVVLGLDVSEIAGVGADVADVSFTFLQVTFSEAV